MIILRTQISPFSCGVGAAICPFAGAAPMNCCHRVGYLFATMLWVFPITPAHGDALSLAHFWAFMPRVALACLHPLAVFRFRSPFSPIAVLALFGFGLLVSKSLLGTTSFSHFGLFLVGIGTLACLRALVIASFASLAPGKQTIRVLLALIELVEGLFNATFRAALEVWYTVHVNLCPFRLATPPADRPARGLRVVYSISRMAVSRITVR